MTDIVDRLRAALAAQPAEPVTHDPAIRWNFDASDTHLLVCREDHDKGDKCEYKQLHPSEVLAIVNRLRISAIELTFRSAAQPAPAAVPPGYALVPIEPTPEMVAAYLAANTEYWRLVDGFPPKIGVWRNGTPSQATAESYRAMTPTPPTKETP